MGEKHLWSGKVKLPAEHYTNLRVAKLVDAMALYSCGVSVPADTPEDEVPLECLVHICEPDEAGTRTFDPQSWGADISEGYAGYYDEPGVKEALVELQAIGELQALYLEGSPETIEIYEALGSQTRYWYQPEEAVLSSDLPGHIRIDRKLFSLQEVEAS